MIQAAVPPLQLWSHSCVRELFQPAGVLGLLTQVRGGKYLVRIFTIYPSPPDCPDNGFCCFDGCVNTCLDGPAPATTRTPPTRPPTPAWTTPPSVLTGPVLVPASYLSLLDGACPAPGPLCTGAVSTCWSPGLPDSDCPNGGFCCFDGCANFCLDDPAKPTSRPTTSSTPPTTRQTTPRPGRFYYAGEGCDEK